MGYTYSWDTFWNLKEDKYIIGYIRRVANKYRAYLFAFVDDIYTSHLTLDAAKKIVERQHGLRRYQPKKRMRVIIKDGKTHEEISFVKQIYVSKVVESKRPYSYTTCGREVSIKKNKTSRSRKGVVTCKICLYKMSVYQDELPEPLLYYKNKGRRK